MKVTALEYENKSNLEVIEHLKIKIIRMEKTKVPYSTKSIESQTVSDFERRSDAGSLFTCYQGVDFSKNCTFSGLNHCGFA